MTNEGEEVEILKAYRDKLFNSTSNQLDKDIKAFDAATKALEQEPSEDAISRQAVDTLVDELARAISDERCCISRGRSTATIMQDILDLPPVTPQPKTGQWIWELEDWNKWTCSECGYFKRTDIHSTLGYKYCPNCGAKMEEKKKEEKIEKIPMYPLESWRCNK